MTAVEAGAAISRRGLSYQVRGDGPTVLLVHGWCLNRTVWMYLEHRLVEAGFRVVAPDLAGYGESRGVPGPYPITRHADDVADLIEELGGGDVTAVGFAFGAAVLLRLPPSARLGRIISIGVPSAAGAPYDRMRSSMLRDWPVFAERSARAICARPQSEAGLEWLGRVFAATPLSSAIAGVDELAVFEPLDEHPRWSVPSLFVHGRDDTIVSPAVSEGCVERFTGAELRIIDDSGHFVPWDQPGALADEVLAFIARTPS